MNAAGDTLDERVIYSRRLLAEVRNEAFEHAYGVAQKVAQKYCRKYAWEDPEDLAQSLMLRFDRIFERYDADNAAQNSWCKYLYWRFSFEAKDYFRRLDPLGVKWPQKKEYPQWHRLQDEGLDKFVIPDHRTDLYLDPPERELLEDWQQWQLVLSAHRRRPMRRSHWDHKNNRVKFRKRRSVTMKQFVEDYRRRQKPQQMKLFEEQG